MWTISHLSPSDRADNVTPVIVWPCGQCHTCHRQIVRTMSQLSPSDRVDNVALGIAWLCWRCTDFLNVKYFHCIIVGVCKTTGLMQAPANADGLGDARRMPSAGGPSHGKPSGSGPKQRLMSRGNNSAIHQVLCCGRNVCTISVKMFWCA